jgi:AcrR family transcriptional regulator
MGRRGQSTMARTTAVAKRATYHHGNLKEALIQAARVLIAERGPAGFTLIEAARQAGVSSAAPYRHFKDRDALLAEICRRGFVLFGERLQAAWRGAEPDAATAFLRMGETYLRFAQEEPGYYAAMFAPRPAANGRTVADPTGSFGMLEAAIRQVAGNSAAGADPHRLAYQVWALSHGIATLAAAGQLPARGKLSPRALLASGVAALISSAGLASAARNTLEHGS